MERAALSGDKHGWVFPDRQASRRPLAARAAERRQPRGALRRANDRAGQRGGRRMAAARAAASVRQSAARISIPPSSEDLDAIARAHRGRDAHLRDHARWA